MQFYEKKLVFSTVYILFNSFLPAIFWILLIFGFEEPWIAVTTLLSALIHECGHVCYITLFAGSSHRLRAVGNGLRIKTVGSLSYREERMTYLSGPLANLLTFVVCFVICLIFRREGDGFLLYFGIINIATALSNLMPIEGYDGYGIIRSLIEEREMGGGILRALTAISAALTFILCILSLYLIDRYSGGYWLFAVFFVSMIKHFDKALSKQKNEI